MCGSLGAGSPHTWVLLRGDRSGGLGAWGPLGWGGLWGCRCLATLGGAVWGCGCLTSFGGSGAADATVPWRGGLLGASRHGRPSWLGGGCSGGSQALGSPSAALPRVVSPPRPDILKPEVLLPKLDAAMAQVALPGCPKGPPSPGRSRRAKGRHRKAGPRGGCGEPGPEAGPPRGLPGPPPAATGPDLLGGTLEAAGVPPATVPDAGPEGATGTQGSPPPRPPAPGEPERESGAGRGGKAGTGQHLTPAALLYRAAVTRGQVRAPDAWVHFWGWVGGQDPQVHPSSGEWYGSFLGKGFGGGQTQGCLLRRGVRTLGSILGGGGGRTPEFILGWVGG